jgi:pimeloyl-ACP methyl ester carboxylesterase
VRCDANARAVVCVRSASLLNNKRLKALLTTYGQFPGLCGVAVLRYHSNRRLSLARALPPTDIWDLIPKIGQPTFGIRGAETDTLVPAAWQLWQMAQPKGKFLNIDGCDHMLPMEKPVEIATAIHEFLSGLAL